MDTDEYRVERFRQSGIYVTSVDTTIATNVYFHMWFLLCFDPLLMHMHARIPIAAHQPITAHILA